MGVILGYRRVTVSDDVASVEVELDPPVELLRFNVDVKTECLAQVLRAHNKRPQASIDLLIGRLLDAQRQLNEAKEEVARVEDGDACGRSLYLRLRNLREADKRVALHQDLVNDLKEQFVLHLVELAS